MKTTLFIAALALAATSACSSSDDAGSKPSEPAAAGRALFASTCGLCHVAAPPGSAAAKMRLVGPNLWGVVGRRSASEDFDYSPAMKQANLVWDEATLDAYLTNPQKTVPNTRMAFPGLTDPQQRKAIIAYLKTQG